MMNRAFRPLFSNPAVRSYAKKIVHNKGAGKAIGAYSPAIQHGNTLYVSGQLGLVDGKLVSEDVQEQAKVALTNMKNIIEGAGSSMDNVLKCTVLLDDISNFSKVNEVYASFFPSNQPARAAFAVKSLPAGGKVEIEAIAAIGE
ncbi:ribonuclease [Acrasis kona]|uniref:Ribonuclease n=1 Tax=Acrasis kona TaxID=1008807 RepID=A0AAW2ZHT4_9EUKA